MSEKPLTMCNDLPDELQEGMERIRDNFLICMVKRAGGKVALPVLEVDMANDLFIMSVDEKDRTFTLEIRTRQ